MLFKDYQKNFKEYIVEPIQSQYTEQLEQLQKIVFPTLADDEILHAAQYKKHIEIFPEGQFLVRMGNEVIGATSTLRYDFDIQHPYHTFSEIMGGGWLTTHNPQGSWLYGLDVSVHPQHRGKGIARVLYEVRQEVVKKLNLQGQIIVGMMSGYGKLKDSMSAEEYFKQVCDKTIFDPTVSVQMKVGFKPILLIPEYLNDPICDNYGILLALDKSVEVKAG